MKTIKAGNVIRWFCIDWEFFGNSTEYHNEIFDELSKMAKVSEVNSGHTGVNVSFENLKLPDDIVISKIKNKIKRFAF